MHDIKMRWCGEHLVQALAYLHDKRIVHRDIKLDNVVLARTDSFQESVAKLIDFGNARVLPKELAERPLSPNSGLHKFDQTSDPSSYLREGTQGFMAPEILRKTGHSLPAALDLGAGEGFLLAVAALSSVARISV